MAPPTYIDAFAELRDPSGPSHIQVTALKHLKNEAIGHLERKRDLIKAGIADVLSFTITKCVDAASSEQQVNGSAQEHAQSSRNLTEDICFQALTLVCTLAQGGYAFASPLIAAGLVSLLFSIPSIPGQQSGTTSASLRALLAIAKSATQTNNDESRDLLASVWFSDGAIKAYSTVLSSETSLPVTRRNVALACSLIDHTVTSEETRNSLENHGIVTLLASHLASYYVHHHPRSSDVFSSMIPGLPHPLPYSGLETLLGATASIISGSASRARVASLLFSPNIFSALPFHQSQVRLDSKLHQSAQQSAYDVCSVDLALPWIHSRAGKLDSHFARAFPALGSCGIRSSDLLDFAEYTPDRSWTQSRGWDSAFVSWLIHIMRVAKLPCRISAARVVLAIVKGGFLSPSKDRSIALLVVPLLLVVIKCNPVQRGMALHNPFTDPLSLAAYRAPRILAELLEEIPTLQRAAVDGNVVRELCTFIKQTFASFEIQADLWSADSASSGMDEDLPPSSTLGDSITSTQIAWLFKCRENGLYLLAAIASREDSYRKKLCDNNMMPCIVDSLSPLNPHASSESSGQSRKQRLDSSYGNPAPVIVAACRAATALSRSISLLRTSLTDAGLAKPIYALVKDSTADVTIAATGVVCNLIMDFSPVRSDFVEAGAMKTLCEHAHSEDLRIRLISLWALKQLMHQAPNEIKTLCINELGTEWLEQIISSNPDSGSPNASKLSTTGNKGVSPFSPAMTGANAKGERVNILQATQDQYMQDSSSEPSPIERDFNTPEIAEPKDFPTGSAAGLHPDSDSVIEKNAQYVRSVKREQEIFIAKQSERDEVQIQRHALDLIRNVTTGPGSNEMLEFLGDAIGFPRLYDIIASKLRRRTTSTHSEQPSSPTTHSPTKSQFHINYQPAPILASTVSILSHIAAGPPKHRQLLVSQSHIISLLRPLFTHPDQDVRTACLWVALNLMWIDDGGDESGARARAGELRKAGWDVEIKARLDDECLDVGERARTADELINGVAPAGSGGGGEAGASGGCAIPRSGTGVARASR